MLRELSADNRYLEVAHQLRDRAPLLAGLALAYAGLNLLLCYGWAILCRGARVPLTTVGAATLFARTHLYRYLPSNLIHFAGRHAALNSLQVSHSDALQINVLEIVLQIVACASLALLLMLGLEELPWAAVQSTLDYRYLGAGLLLVGTLAALVIGLGRARSTTTLPRNTLLGAAGVYLLFFLGFGVLAASWATTDPQQSALVVLVTCLAWLGGAVIPGASAGLGVREMILVSGLSATTGPAAAVTLALALRLITVGGDLLLALFAWLVPVSSGSAGADSLRAGPPQKE